jgi:hypothetical protein
MRRLSAVVHRVVSAGTILALAFVTACGGGGDTGTTPTPNPTGGFSLSVSATTPATIVQAGSGTATVTVSRSGSFTGAVALSVEGAPSGVTVTPSAASVAGGSTTSTLAIDVSLNVPAGTYPLTIRGQASGQAAQTATLNLVVVTRPASVTLSRSSAGALLTNAGGPNIVFSLILNRIEYLGAVTLEVASGLPAGVTATFTNSPTSGNSIGVTLAVAASTAPGAYTAELRATGTGIAPATLSVPFTVLGQGSLTVGVSRSTVSIPQNGSGVTSVTVARTNFTGAVTLAVAGLPSGATGTFDTNPIGTNGSSLTFAAGPSVLPGTYPITITASAPQVATPATVVMTLIITATGTGGNTVFRFCGTAADIPIWFGFASSNSWTRVTMGASSTFTFDFPTSGSVTWVTQHGPDDFRINIAAGTRDEMALIASGQCPSPSNRTATGSVAGVGVADLVQVVLGPRSPTTAPTFGTPTFSFTALPDGAMDLLATRSALATGSLAASRVLLQRAINPANGGSVGTLDFNGGSAITPETKTLSVVGGAGGEQLSMSSSFRTANGASINLSTAFPSTGTSGVISHLPAAQQQAGDFHTLQASASATAGGYTITRSVTQTVASPASTSLTLGAVPGEPNVFVFASNADRARFTSLIPAQADYSRLFIASWLQQSGNTRRDVIMTVTDAMAPITSGSSGTNAQLRVPDFAAAPGWNPLWESRPGLPATYFISASGWTAAGGLAAPLTDGVITKSYTRVGPVP